MAKRTSEPRSEKTLDRAEAIREEEGDLDFPERYAQDGIQQRREQVWKFLARRVPQTVMAELLGVSRRTITADVKWWKDQCQDYVDRLKKDPAAANTDIGLTALRLEGMAQMAMNEAEMAKSSQMKNVFMNTAIKAEVSRSNLLISTGVLPKAGEEIRVRHDISATFTAKLGENNPLSTLDDAASRRRVLSAAEHILKLGMAKKLAGADDPTTIDVEVKDAK